MIYLDEGIDEHPKFVELHPEACWLWVQLLAYCRRNKTDGQVPKTVPSRCHHGSKKLATLIDQLTNSPPSRPDLGPLLHRTAHGYELHDYLVWNKSKAEIDEDIERKRVAGRKGGEAKALAGGKQAASTPLTLDPGSRAHDLPIHDPRSTIHDPRKRDQEPPNGGVRAGAPHERDGISIPEGSRDPYGIAPPGEDPDAYPGSVPSSPPVLTHPTPKPRRGAKPRPARLDLDETELTGDEAAIVTAIRSDPSLAPIVDRPCSLARDLKLAAPGCHVVQEVRRAGAWLRGNPAKAKSNGYRFLLGWLQRAQERGPRGPVVEEPPPRPPVKLPDHPPRPMPATLEELDALHRAEDAEALRRATPVGIDALPFVEDLADMPDDADGGEVFS